VQGLMPRRSRRRRAFAGARRRGGTRTCPGGARGNRRPTPRRRAHRLGVGAGAEPVPARVSRSRSAAWCRSRRSEPGGSAVLVFERLVPGHEVHDAESRKPRPAPGAVKNPSSSGPRCTSVPAMSRRIPAGSAPRCRREHAHDPAHQAAPW